MIVNRLILWMALYFTVVSSGEVAHAERIALLIGCSDYQSEKIDDLPGAANDVLAFKQLLENELDFDRVTTLTGWTDDVATRPTHDRIHDAFEQLIESASLDSQVFILLSGHGTNVPVPESQANLLDVSNPEPDGLNEAFLPADAHAGENLILDDQIGQWLDQLQEKGSHVWIVFDCCHSGTMTRSVGASDEVPRYVSPSVVGVSAEVLEAARQRVEKGANVSSEGEAKELAKPRQSKGSVVAFFAAKAHQTEAELIRPKNSGIKRGLLAYHLEQELRGRKSGITYGDLSRALISRYQADGRRHPSPFWAGDLNREVFGLRSWPEQKPMFLSREGDALVVSGGRLAGLNQGTVLEVFAPSDKAHETPIGTVEVKTVNATSAIVEPTESSVAANWPNNGSCRILYHESDRTPLRLSLLALSGSALKPLPPEGLATAIRQQFKDSSILVNDESNDCDWAFVLLEETGDAVLVLGEELQRLLQNGMSSLEKIPQARFKKSDLGDVAKIAAEIESNLTKVEKWSNLNKLMVAAGAELDPNQDVRIEARAADGLLIGDSQLKPGEIVELRATNKNLSRDYWYVILQLNSHYGIGLVGGENGLGVGTLRHAPRTAPPRPQPIYRFRCNDDASGSFGLIVIAMNTRDHPHTPNFGFLRQENFGAVVNRHTTESPTTEFERLLNGTLKSPTKFRNQQGLDRPQILTWTWTVSPP